MRDMNDFRKSLYDAVLSAGIPVISGDKCCRLLAWLYLYGGGNEQVVFDGRLNAAIMYAQRRLNIGGGEIPDGELVPVLQDYIKSVTDWYNPPEWVAEIEAEYRVEVYREKHFGGVKDTGFIA